MGDTVRGASTPKSIRVLAIGGTPDDEQLIRTCLTGTSSLAFGLEWTSSLRAGLERLTTGGVDVVLLDLSFPDGQRQDPVATVRGQAPNVPLVIVVSRDQQARAIDAIRRGAQDYVLKDAADRTLLPRVVRYALERARAEQTLRESREQLTAENKRLEELAILKDEFVAKVSHELRSPLTAIKEGINLVLDEALGSINAEQRDFLQTVDENIDRLTELINNMLDLSKIEAGRLSLVRRRLALGPLIATTLSSYKTLAGRRQLKMDLVPVPDVLADPPRVLQILGNLFSNAVKFTEDEGTITMALREQDGAVAVSVQDDGIGMAPDELPKLFQKFSQVGAADQQPQGSGLGLALCKELIELHKGRIAVSSELGTGSTFTFCLPIYTTQLALQESFRELVEAAKRAEEGTVGVIALDGEPLVSALASSSGRMSLSASPLEHLESLVELVRQSLHRGDIVLDVEPRWVVVLVLADTSGVQAVVQRLRKALQERLTSPGKPGPDPAQFGAAMYPGDGMDIHTLFWKATRTLNQGVTSLEPVPPMSASGAKAASTSTSRVG